MKVVDQNQSRPAPADHPDLDACFPQAALYRLLPHTVAHSLHEPTLRRKTFPYSERHLHCLWYDPRLRPAPLHTREGEPVIVEDPGIWNQEAGPDFLGAVLHVGREQRRVSGDVEIHIHPSDWKAHGHSADTRYDRVRFHVTYFPGAETDINPVPGALQIILRDAILAVPGFSFDQIDPTAYPYAARAQRPPCANVLQDFTHAERLEVLRAAGEERLRRKSERLALFIAEYGPEQALYTELMAALGYKHNKAGFRHLASLVPVDELRRNSQGQPRIAYALLLGIAGLLPNQPKPHWSAETQRWIRALWDEWWRFRERYAHRGPPPHWNLAGVRPANHPARRLMGAAHLFCQNHPAAKQLRDLVRRHPQDWIDRWIKIVTALQDPYFSPRPSLTGQPGNTPLAFIGPTRAAAMATNVLIPFIAAVGDTQSIRPNTLDHLPVEADNGIVRQTAFHLFGQDHSPSLRKTALSRQGLQQIFQDFCLNDRSRCATCPFPAALTRYSCRNA